MVWTFVWLHDCMVACMPVVWLCVCLYGSLLPCMYGCIWRYMTVTVCMIDSVGKHGVQALSGSHE